jgi:glycerophosphoryl diester phosphodiesterase
VAHRGASAERPENTLGAFERAVEVGAPAIEFDVRVTADGHAVVVHDASVDRTTNGSGVVRSMTLDEVRALEIATGDGDPEHVPTLEEVLRFASSRAAVDVEIKNLPGEPDFDPERELAVEALHRALDDVGFVGPVIVSSFNPRSIAASRTMRPEVPTGLLTEYSVDAEAALTYAAAEGHAWVLPFLGKVREAGEGFPSDVHRAGLLLGTWLTDDPDEALALFASGVDAVATNDPRAVVAACATLEP